MTCTYCQQTQPTDKPCWACPSRQGEDVRLPGGLDVLPGGARECILRTEPAYTPFGPFPSAARYRNGECRRCHPRCQADTFLPCEPERHYVSSPGERLATASMKDEHQAASPTREEPARSSSPRQPTRLPLPVPGERGALQAELESWALENGFGSAFAPFPPDRDNSAAGQSRETPDE